MSEEHGRSNPRLDRESDDVESASIDSFPASDPPKWGSLRLGPPIHLDPSPEAAEEGKHLIGGDLTTESRETANSGECIP